MHSSHLSPRSVRLPRAPAGPYLVCESDAPALLLQIEHNARPVVADVGQRQLQLLRAVALEAPKHFPREARVVHAHGYLLEPANLAHQYRQVLARLATHRVAVRAHAEVPRVRRQLRLGHERRPAGLRLLLSLVNASGGACGGQCARARLLHLGTLWRAVRLHPPPPRAATRAPLRLPALLANAVLPLGPILHPLTALGAPRRRRREVLCAAPVRKTRCPQAFAAPRAPPQQRPRAARVEELCLGCSRARARHRSRTASQAGARWNNKWQRVRVRVPFLLSQQPWRGPPTWTPKGVLGLFQWCACWSSLPPPLGELAGWRLVSTNRWVSRRRARGHDTPCMLLGMRKLIFTSFGGQEL